MTNYSLEQDTDIVRPIDVTVHDQGTIVLLAAQTDEASHWLSTHLDQDGPRWGGSYVVETRYVNEILVGLVEDGLTLAPR